MQITKAIGCFIALVLFSGAAIAQTRIVDNRDQEKITSERLNLRTTASASGDVVGSYYTGTEVEIISEEETEGYIHVTVGGKTGYMASDYLQDSDVYTSLYGAPKGRSGEVNLVGLWLTSESMHSDAKSDSETIATLTDGTPVEVYGFVGNWAYVKTNVEGTDLYGYLPQNSISESGNSKIAILMSNDNTGNVPLMSLPNKKSDELMVVQNGTPGIILFGRSSRTWYHIRIGGVSGWVQNEPASLIFLSGAPRSSVPYYPPLMQTKEEVLLTSQPGNTDHGYITLGEEMKVEVLGITNGGYAYVRTYEGGAGAYESGDFGYLLSSSLMAVEGLNSIGVAQADDGDIPVVLLNTPDKNARTIGALVPGAEVRIGEYTQTDYVQLSLSGLTVYTMKKNIRLLTEGSGTPSDRIPQRSIVVNDTALLSEPVNGAKETGTVAAGSKVYMLAKCGEWAFVNAAARPHLNPGDASQDLLGFVRLSQLSAPAGTTHLTATVTTDKVNMRERADRSSRIVAKARLGELLRVADYGTNWTCVIREDGTRGFLMTEYLNFD